MNMPGFAAEASLYRSNAHYSSSSCPGYVSGNQVSPQSCGGFKQLFCNGLILACNGCLALLPSIPLVLGCYAVCLGGWYGYCGECLDVIDIPPVNGGGGGGGGGMPKTCCERNEWGRCIVWVPKGEKCL
jgi:hypothetical protein